MATLHNVSACQPAGQAIKQDGDGDAPFDRRLPPSCVRVAQDEPPASQRWGGIVLALLIAVLGSLALGGCATQNAAVYKLYPGPTLPDAEISTLRFGDGVHALRLDGLSVHSGDYGAIQVLPGQHHLAYGATFAVSVMVNPNMVDSTDTSHTVDLVAGHHYAIQADRTTGHGYRMYLWIEDLQSGEVIAGEKMP